MTPAEILRGAADEIRAKGWCQGGNGGLAGESGPCCVMVAILRSGHTGKVGGVEAFAARQAFHRTLGGEALTQWNDRPGRTVDEVLEMLEQAAKSVEVSS